MKSALALSFLPAPLPLSYNQQGVGDVDVADPSKPLEVLVGPITLKQRDRLELFWGANDDVIDTYTHSSDFPDTNGTFSLYVDTRWIKSGITEVRYAYLPFPSNTPEHSPVQKVIVKLDLPGGRDPDPATPYENEKLQLPVISPTGVITVPENVSVTVPLYENMAAGDVIAVYWNGIEVACSPLTEAQLGKPVIVDISPEVIIEAGDSENIVVRYEIRDIVNNWSRFSLPVYVAVDVGLSSLPAPIAPQAPDMQLDLDKLAGGEIQALVLSNPNIVTGDTIEFVVERSTAEGISLEPYVASKVVQVPGSFVEFLIANDQFQPIAQGRARLKYTVRKGSGEALRSKSLPLAILGEALLLEPPRVPAAVDGILDPGLLNVIAEVPPYHFMADGNDVTFVLMGRTPGGETVMHDEVKNLNQDDVGKTLEFLIPDDKISALAGGSVELHYTVTTYNRALFKSPVLQLLIDVDNSTLLPAPLVDHVGADGVLDPANVVLEAIVRITPYQAMAEGDRVTVHWDGRVVDGTYSTSTVINSGTVNREVVFRVPKRFVDVNVDNNVEAWYEVQRGDRTARSSRQLIHVRELKAPDVPTPTVKQATGNTLDPVNAPQGATVVIDASAAFKAGDRVTVQWKGPKGSDTKEKTLVDSEAGQLLETVFAPALVVANAGHGVELSYTVNRANGLVQASETLALQIVASLAELPAPRMDTVGDDGVVTPSQIPESGATVRVSYPGMSAEDSVVVNWRGGSSHDTAAQSASGSELLFTIPKTLILAAQGGSASVTYTVTRSGLPGVSAPLWLTVQQELVFDTSSVTLDGRVYLIPSVPDLLPTLGAGTSVKRQATGGLAPYRYASSNPLVAKVDGNGLTTVRGNGTAIISVTDASGSSKSYQVVVTHVIHCIGLGSGNLTQMSSAASAKGGRIPSINELKEIYATYGSRWPLGQGNYWSSTIAAQNLVGWKWYFVKNLVTGADFKLLHHNASLGVAIR